MKLPSKNLNGYKCGLMSIVGQKIMKPLKINFKDKFSKFPNEDYAVRIVAMMNNYEIKIVKRKGESIWHSHPDTDETFIILDGKMQINFRDKVVALRITGHLTFSTLHTNDAPSAIARLYKMGIEPFLLASAVNIIVAQRLVRTLCENCKKPIPKDEVNVSAYVRFGFLEDELKEHTLFKAGGCEKCGGTGYKGRLAIHEALYMTKELKHIVMTAGIDIDEDSIRAQAVKDGMWTLRRAGIIRVLEGVTTMEEVAATTTEE